MGSLTTKIGSDIPPIGYKIKDKRVRQSFSVNTQFIFTGGSKIVDGIVRTISDGPGSAYTLEK
jgi:hypothetical protein